MKNSVVKTTFLDGLLNMFLPYYCRGCGRTGAILCEDCREEIEGPVKDFRGKKIELGEIDELYVGGWREGMLKKLIEDYKFKSVKKISGIFVDILDEAVPGGIEAVVVPLPTINKHIRQRGFDHTKWLAEEFAKRRGMEMREVLRRVNKTVQVGADEETRQRQAEGAYAVDLERFAEAQAKKGEAQGGESKARESGDETDVNNTTYLLLDDVWTTGASMRAAAKKLREAGAKRIVGAVASLNPGSGR